MEIQLTQLQISKLQEVINGLEKSTMQIGSDCEIEKLKYYSDLSGNFYLSYTCIMSGADRSVTDFYIKIDTQGAKTILNYDDLTENELKDFFSFLIPVIL